MKILRFFYFLARFFDGAKKFNYYGRNATLRLSGVFT